MKPGPGRIIAIVIALLLLVAVIPKACAQVMLPHRHTVPHLLTSGYSNADCGSPPVWTNLVQWLCAKTFTGAGVSESTSITNWPDISPALTNGVYFTNIADTLKPVYHSAGQNSMPFVTFGDPPGKSSPMANSNAWWTGVTEAQIYYVLKLFTNSTANSLERLGSTSSDEKWWDDPTTTPILAFGSTAAKTLAATNSMHLSDFCVFSMWSKASDWGALSNNVTIYTNAVNTVGFPATAGEGVIGRTPLGYQLFGDIYEVLVFTNKLTSSQNTNVWLWLKGKYGL